MGKREDSRSNGGHCSHITHDSTNLVVGFIELAPRICRMDEHLAGHCLGLDQPRHVPRRR